MWKECFEIINTVEPFIWVSIYSGPPEKMSQTHNLFIDIRTETDKKKDRAKECSKKPRETNLHIGRQKIL